MCAGARIGERMRPITVVVIAAVTAAIVALAVDIYLRIRDRGPAGRAPDPKTTFTTALDNTLFLMAYAAGSGKPLSDVQAVAAVLAAKAAGDPPPPAVEQAFWVAASSISKAVSPVTVDSLIASLPPPSGGRSKAAHAARSFMLITVVALVALLVVQIYWLTGATIVSQLKDDRAQLEKLSAEGLARDSTLAALDRKAKDYATRERLSQASYPQWRTRLSMYGIDAHTNFQLLRSWNRWSLTTLPLGRPQPAVDLKPGAAPVPRDSVYFLWEFTEANVQALTRAQVMLATLLKYWLPLLYGLLGACAYIVRTVGTEIQDRTYAAGSTARYHLRLFLGAVAGFSIAWFTSDTKPAESAGLLQSLSPLALAFLAGYSVELLFALLDRFVTAFSGPQPKPGG